MSKPFKLRFVSEIVGVFVILCVLCLVVGIILAGKAQGWFEPQIEVRTRLPAEGTFGLQKGAEVQVLQTTVGSVRAIEVNDEGEMEAVLQLKGDFTRFITTNSTILLRKKFTVAGDTYAEISRGTGERVPDTGAYLPCKTDTDLIEEVRGLLTSVQDNINRVVNQLQDLLEEHAQLAAGLRDPRGSLQKILANVEGVTRGLEEGQGSAGRILRDDTLARELEKTAASLNQSMLQVEQILESVKATAAEDVPDLLLQTESMIYETEELMKGIQRHWLFRKYIPQEAAERQLLPLDSVRGGGEP